MMKQERPAPCIAFVLGKPPRAETIFPAVMHDLRQRGFSVHLHLPHEHKDTMPPWLDEAAMIVHRGLRPASLHALAAYESRGRRCINPVEGVRVALDRWALHERLVQAGLPVPRARLAEDWKAASAFGEKAHVVLKQRDASRGRGAGTAFLGPGKVPELPLLTGPFLVQDHVAGDGWDRKVYVVGRSVWGLLKPWPRLDVPHKLPFRPSPMLEALALHVGSATGLSIYGVDFIEHDDGSASIVDVNAFPSFQGIDGAAKSVAGHVVDHLQAAPKHAIGSRKLRQA